jgi:hypothetical protein
MFFEPKILRGNAVKKFIGFESKRLQVMPFKLFYLIYLGSVIYYLL